MGFLGVIVFVLLLLSLGSRADERQLLIFGVNQPEFKKQLHLLKQDSIGLADRDLVIYTHNEGSALHKKYAIKPGQFAIILIGKDGGEKFRSFAVVQPETLFALIDSMPMRKAEMRKNK